MAPADTQAEVIAPGFSQALKSNENHQNSASVGLSLEMQVKGVAVEKRRCISVPAGVERSRTPRENVVLEDAQGEGSRLHSQGL